MAVVDYESIQIPEGYLNMRINRYKRKYVIDYLQEYGTYPSIEDIVNIPIPDEVMTHIKQSYYVNYLINEADKIDGDIVVPEIPEESQIEVNPNNIAGYWELTKWNGVEISDNFMYIKFDRTDRSYILVQDLDSMTDLPYHTNTGSFDIYMNNNKYVLRGQYDYDCGDWPHNYYVTLTDTKMSWTAYDDPKITYEFSNKGILCDKLIFGTYKIVNDIGNVYATLTDDLTFELYQKLGEQTNYTKYTGTFELRYNKPNYYIDFKYSDGNSGGEWEFIHILPDELVMKSADDKEHNSFIRIDMIPEDVLNN